MRRKRMFLFAIWSKMMYWCVSSDHQGSLSIISFSPLELVFRWTVRGPLKLLKEKCLCENTDISMLDYVSGCKHTFIRACEIAHENIKQSQIKMKLVW
jgi:hypothetical protein